LGADRMGDYSRAIFRETLEAFSQGLI
jgi:hypothetical protein